MTLLRRVLMARGGSGTVPVWWPFTITSAPAGGWVQVITPRAVRHGTNAYVGYLRGDNGDVCVRSVTLPGHAISAETVLHAALEVDSHDNPAIFVRSSDHRILAVYTKHDHEPTFYYRISTNPEDVSSFAAEQTKTIGTTLTYPSLAQLSGESGKVYLFLRNETDGGATADMVQVTSTDGGATWSAMTTVYRKPSAQSYWVAWSNGTDRIDLAVSDGNGVGSPTGVSVYHLYWQAGSWHRTDGTVIASSLPLATSDLTRVYDGSAGNSSWPHGIMLDASGRPVIVHQEATHATGGLADQFTVRWARWTGSAWSDHAVVNDDSTGLPLVATSCLDPLDSRTVHACVTVSGHKSWFKYETSDNGATWAATLLRAGAAGDENAYPAPVIGASADLRVVETAGSYTSYLVNSLGIMGAGV